MLPTAPQLLAHPMLGPLIRRLQAHPKRIVFPEPEDPRVFQVAQRFVELECASPILVGNKSRLREMARQENVSTEFIRLLQPDETSEFQPFCERYKRTRRYLRRPVPDTESIMAQPGYFAAMLTLYNGADAIVGGNCELPAVFFRSLLHILPLQFGVDSATSFLPVFLPDRPEIGDGGRLILADCAVIPSPTIAQTAQMAAEAAQAATGLLAARPRIALLSFANRDSTRTASTEKTLAAVELTRQRLREYGLSDTAEVDGPLQLDAALDQDAATRKAGPSSVAGRANVLVFPDLNSSHIAFKLLKLIGNAETFGHQIVGLTRPAAQVSRVASEISLFGAAILAAHQSALMRPKLLLEA